MNRKKPLLLLLVYLLCSRAARVAVVTGASRGIGKGIAIELGRAGFTVYALGRSQRGEPPPDGERQRAVLPGTEVSIEQTAEDVTLAGGVGKSIRCDVARDEDVKRAFSDVAEAEGRLDVLVCSAFQTPPPPLRAPFWEQGTAMWDAISDVGLRGMYSTCVSAVPLMIRTAKADVFNSNSAGGSVPLICLVSSFGGKSYTFNVAYGVGKAATDRLARDMAVQLREHGIATRSLYPGVVRTEGNLEMLRVGTWGTEAGGISLDVDAETPSFSGKAVAALAALEPEQLMERTGQVEVVAELATTLGYTEDDGSTPPSIRSLAYLLPNFVFPQIEKEAGKPLPAWLREIVPDLLLPWSVFEEGQPPSQPSAD